MAKCNLSGLTIVGFMLIILALIGLIWLLKSTIFENFIMTMNDAIIPRHCYNYLVTDGENYYLLNTTKFYDGVTNPRKFETREEADKYLKHLKCPDLKPIDLVVKKSKRDPTITPEYECAKHVAAKQFDFDICNTYMPDEYSIEDVTKRIKQLKLNREMEMENYDLEECLIKKIQSEYPVLNDQHFLSQFEKYFKQTSENIKI